MKPEYCIPGLIESPLTVYETKMNNVFTSRKLSVLN